MLCDHKKFFLQFINESKLASDIATRKSGLQFKGINKFKVYHFGSITTRKKKDIIQNRGEKTFLKKWGI